MITIDLARSSLDSGQIGGRFKPSDLGFSLERSEDGYVIWANYFALARVSEHEFKKMLGLGHARNSRLTTALMTDRFHTTYQRLGGPVIHRCTPVIHNGIFWLEAERDDRLDLLLLHYTTDPRSARYIGGAHTLLGRTNGDIRWKLTVLPKGGAVCYSDKTYDYQTVAAKYLL